MSVYTDMNRKYTREILEPVVNSSKSVRECLTKLDLVEAGGNYQTIQKHIKNFELNTSHFHGKAWNKGLIIGPKRPIEDYLSNKYPIGSHSLRLKLISEKIFEPICSDCKGSVWKNQPIPLELDHIDGNHQNNDINNLRLLCPNCHALTENYRGRSLRLKHVKLHKIRSYIRQPRIEKQPLKKMCDMCKSIYIPREKTSKYCCYDCFHLAQRKCQRPSKNELSTMIIVEKIPFTRLGKKYGVTDNAVRKWAKQYGIIT